MPETVKSLFVTIPQKDRCPSKCAGSSGVSHQCFLIFLTRQLLKEGYKHNWEPSTTSHHLHKWKYVSAVTICLVSLYFNERLVYQIHFEYCLWSLIYFGTLYAVVMMCAHMCVCSMLVVGSTGTARALSHGVFHLSVETLWEEVIILTHNFAAMKHSLFCGVTFC